MRKNDRVCGRGVKFKNAGSKLNFYKPQGRS